MIGMNREAWLRAVVNAQWRFVAWTAASLLVLGAPGCGQPPPPAAVENAPHRDPAKQIELLNSNDPVVQLLAIDNLRRLGPEAAVALPELEKMKGDSDPRVQKAARDAIDAIRPNSTAQG